MASVTEREIVLAQKDLSPNTLLHQALNILKNHEGCFNGHFFAQVAMLMIQEAQPGDQISLRNWNFSRSLENPASVLISGGDEQLTEPTIKFIRSQHKYRSLHFTAVAKGMVKVSLDEHSDLFKKMNPSHSLEGGRGRGKPRRRRQ